MFIQIFTIVIFIFTLDYTILFMYTLNFYIVYDIYNIFIISIENKLL